MMGVIDPDWLQAWMIADFTVKETMLQQARDVKILGIDDLGMEQNNDRIQAIIEIILNHRYTEEMTTIITTNLSMERFKERYSERIVDRIREWGIFYEITDTSFRADPYRLQYTEEAMSAAVN